jgi:hypothetical protein
MKLWRKTGWRKLSGRLYGTGRDTVRNKIPSPLIYALIARTQPQVIKMNETYAVHPMNGVQPITMT